MGFKSPSKHPAKSYRETHWGLNPKRVVHVPDQPGMPKSIVEMGKLDSIRTKDLTLRFSRGSLAYDAPPRARLYLLLTKQDQARAKRRLIHPEGEWYSIKAVAAAVGGRQARLENRTVKVQAIGRATHVDYRTAKKGDGHATYTHRLGEDGGIEPMLCVDREGRLYLVGGSNEVKVAGIIR